MEGCHILLRENSVIRECLPMLCYIFPSTYVAFSLSPLKMKEINKNPKSFLSQFIKATMFGCWSKFHFVYFYISFDSRSLENSIISGPFCSFLFTGIFSFGRLFNLLDWEPFVLSAFLFPHLFIMKPHRLGERALFIKTFHGMVLFANKLWIL